MHRRDALKAHRGTGHLLGCPMDFNGDNILSSRITDSSIREYEFCVAGLIVVL